MKALTPLLVTTVLSLIFADASLEALCKKAMDYNHGSEGPDCSFCVTSLLVDPKSPYSDTRGLGVIATTIAKANLTYNLAMSNELLNYKDMLLESKGVLNTCIDVYGLSINSAERAIEAIVSNDLGTALAMLSGMKTFVYTCIDSWKEFPEETPLMVKENADAYKLCGVALAITHMLTQ